MMGYIISLMKRGFLIVLLSLILASSSYSQEYKTSMGIRAGLPIGLTLKHFLNRDYALEGMLATRWGGITLAGFLEKEHRVKNHHGLYWFWGGGIHSGIWDAGYNPRLKAGYTGPVFGIDGIIGLEYTLDYHPLNFSFDLYPSLNLIGSAGWGGINGAVSVRYVF
jgi:hypothetical protein